MTRRELSNRLSRLGEDAFELALFVEKTRANHRRGRSGARLGNVQEIYSQLKKLVEESDMLRREMRYSWHVDLE